MRPDRDQMQKNEFREPLKTTVENGINYFWLEEEPASASPTTDDVAVNAAGSSTVQNAHPTAVFRQNISVVSDPEVCKILYLSD